MKAAVAALVLALAGASGSLLLTLGMGFPACPLCLYQRTFIMAAAAVLAFGLLADRARAGLYCLLCLPLALAGLGVAGYQEYLIISGIMLCQRELFGPCAAPAQSLAMFIALTIAVAAGAERRARVIVVAAVVGALLAWSSIATASPPLSAPKVADGALRGCEKIEPGGQCVRKPES